jgi:hypothetical protein
LSCPACGQQFVYIGSKIELGDGESLLPAFAKLFDALLTLENARVEFVFPARPPEIILAAK